MNVSKLVFFALAVPLLWACAPIASVEEKSPEMPAALAQSDSSAEIKRARQLDESATALIKSDPKEAMVESETAAQLCLEAINAQPAGDNNEAISLYDYSVARLVEATFQSGEKPWEHEVDLSGPNGPIQLTMTDESKGSWMPQGDQLISSDRLEIGGTYFTHRVRVDGVGNPMVSKGPGRTEPWAPDEHYFGVTAIAEIQGSHCAIEILDPGQTLSTTLIDKNPSPVAADLSAPIALSITETHPEEFGVSALLHTDKFMDAAQMIMDEPYRANRQPVILIHGLLDSPTSWVPMINALNASPEIRKKYQIWTYRYPSGLPFPLSAELLRQELAAIYKKYPRTQKAILVGHSMGGLLAHMLICDSGDKFCEDVLGKPLSQFNVEPDEFKMLQGALYFKRSPYVKEAIFMATPHRGANMASDPLGRLGASMIQLPGQMDGMGPKLTAQVTPTEGEELIERFPNSIDTLRPEARVVKALNELTIPSSVPYYSIIGDRGRGDTPKSSDGVVAYESSHLDGAKSELIVPSDHLVQQNPQGIAEVQRILLSP